LVYTAILGGRKMQDHERLNRLMQERVEEILRAVEREKERVAPLDFRAHSGAGYSNWGKKAKRSV
jgi:hypothetical protein